MNSIQVIPYPDPKSSIFLPKTPFWGSIPHGLSLGNLIELSGPIPSYADVFEINFTEGRDDGKLKFDRPFHISVRFGPKLVVRNMLKSERWCTEERTGIFPFVTGRLFNMLILVESDRYRIAVDGRHQWDFVHRVPFTAVKMLHIEGTVQLNKIRYYDTPVECTMKSWPKESSVLFPVINPPSPFSYKIPGGIMSSMLFYISGKPAAGALRFTVNFVCFRGYEYPEEDIAFHFDARVNQSVIVRNTRINSNWGKEETNVPFFPFECGVFFDIIVLVKEDRFMIAINNEHFLEYRHRVYPISKINMLNVQNDVVISAIRFSQC